ncbi:hypothetical protein H2202_008765 [Exophiala xenobiotica]|nr:hypothetical protein H2202_008765 [Exophiala xenobiotica]
MLVLEDYTAQSSLEIPRTVPMLDVKEHPASEYPAYHTLGSSPPHRTVQMSRFAKDRFSEPSRSWFHAFARVVLSIVPSLFSILAPGSYTADKSGRHTTKITSLDGLRGIACLFVFHAHFAYSFGNCLEEAEPDVLSKRVMYQPFISLTWSGTAMVDVFFVISGYVLVSKPLRLLYSQNVSGALSTISSAVFRRAFRLYLPSMAIIMIASIMTSLNLFEAGTAFYNQTHDGIKGPQEQPPVHVGSFMAQLYSGFKDCYRLADNTVPWGRANIPYENEEWARPAGMVYDRHLWTIPVEFRCSMLIFAILVGTARIRSRWRLGINLMFFLNCLLTERFPESLFIAGMILAEVDTIQHQKSNDSLYIVRPQHTHELKLPGEGYAGTPFQPCFRELLGLLMFVPGLFLLSVPSRGAEQYPAFSSILMMVPTYLWEKDRLVRAIGAIMVTWPVATSSIIAPLFTNAFANYLGQISFALYLVHGSLIKSVWYWLQPKLLAMINPDATSALSTQQFIDLWLSGYIVMLALVLSD